MSSSSWCFSAWIKFTHLAVWVYPGYIQIFSEISPCWTMQTPKKAIKLMYFMYINSIIRKNYCKKNVQRSVTITHMKMTWAPELCYIQSGPLYTATSASALSPLYSNRVQLLWYWLASSPLGSAPLLLPRQRLYVTPKPTPTQESDTCVGVAAVSPPACWSMRQFPASGAWWKKAGGLAKPSSAAFLDTVKEE